MLDLKQYTIPIKHDYSFLQTKKEIEDWLNRNGMHKYTIVKNEDSNKECSVPWVVNCEESVHLMNLDMDMQNSHIPVKFNIVNGDFNVSGNRLKNLLFAPKTVKDEFNAENNLLQTLEGLPEIGGAIRLSSNRLTSLKGSPKTVNGTFEVSCNRLTSLEGGPTIVKDYYFCMHNDLSTLAFFPSTVGSTFICDHNPRLGHTQNITLFQNLLEIHRIENIEMEKNKLEKTLAIPVENLIQLGSSEGQHKI